MIVHVFLPIYFASSGMKTQLGTLNSVRIWFYTVVVIVVASSAKIVSVTLSSKLVLSIREAKIKQYLEEEQQEQLLGRGFERR